jgi:tetratricopeptide (TPR) repeat protein
MKLNRSLIFLSVICIIQVYICSLPLSSALASPDPPRQSAEALFQQGNDLYGQGKYRQALDVYTRIITEYGVSGPLLYNLANCHAQTGRTGQAIVNYERALRLSPGDSDTKGNLDLIRKNQGLFEGEVSLAHRLGSLLYLDQWTMLAALLYVLFTLNNLTSLYPFPSEKIRQWINGLCLLLLVIVSMGIFSQFRQLNEAVVIDKDARLLLSPFPSASLVGTIQEGRVVHSLSKHGTYSLVEDESGRTGWVETNAIGCIIEPNPLQRTR